MKQMIKTLLSTAIGIICCVAMNAQDTTKPQMPVVPADTVKTAAPAPPAQPTPTLAPTPMFEQENVGTLIKQQTMFAIGAQIGLATGTGISFRTTLTNRFAFEANAFFFSTGRAFWDVGAEVQYSLSSANEFRIYALAGFGVFYSEDEAGVNGIGQPFRIGLGPGFEYYIAPMVALGAELPFAVWVASGNTVVIPTPQVHFLYYFN